MGDFANDYAFSAFRTYSQAGAEFRPAGDFPKGIRPAPTAASRPELISVSSTLGEIASAPVAGSSSPMSQEESLSKHTGDNPLADFPNVVSDGVVRAP